MERKMILVIGAGVSGLSAGIYAEKMGYHAIILEKNPSVGGLCTGWTRKDKYIDGCIHWLTGTNKETDLYQMWQDVGAIDETTNIVKLDTWGVFEHDGIKVPFYRDLDKAEKEWISISPIDEKQIKKFFKLIRKVMSVNLPLYSPFSMLKFKDVTNMGLSILKVWPSYLSSMRMSCEKYAKKFKSPAIRWAISHAQPGDGNLFSMVYSYGTIAMDNGDIPEGGSKPMVERMKNKFLSLGGTLILNANVRNILIKNDIAIGAALMNGTNYYADYVVTALDANFTMNQLLMRQYKLDKLERRYLSMEMNPAPSCCVIAFEGDLVDMPNPYSFECEPFYLGSELISHITLRSFAYDKNTYVKDGKCIYEVLLDQYSKDYKYWNELFKESNTLYRKKKEEIAMAVCARIKQKMPQFADNLEVLDIFTPKTLNRYTNASRGTYMGFLFTPRSFAFSHNGKVSGLDNFYLAGQYMQCPGGLPLALTTGKHAIQRIDKREKQKVLFTSSRVLSSKNAS